MLVKPIFPVVDYVVNYQYISKELCVNKAKPELKCNGKCHLMKELAKASEDEKPISSNKKDNSKHEIEVLFYQELQPIIASQIYFHSNSLVENNYSNNYFHLTSCSVFHPPIFIS
jgi:hypothetical protein